MNRNVLDKIERKTGLYGIAALLAERLSGSELSSLLLDVYRRKTGMMRPAELLAQYRLNRLVQPSALDMIGLLESELKTLRFFRDRGFLPVELSPAAALGSCSVVAAVSQDKVISSLRNTEVVADATNSLALHVADRRKAGEKVLIRFSTVHRHVRTQPFADKRFLPHFKIGCMVSAGRDIGSHGFECEELVEHVGIYNDLLRGGYGVRGFRLLLKKRMGYDERNPLIDQVELRLRQRLEGVVIEREEAPPSSDYYKGVQFKLYIMVNGREWEIADGGFVDWTQKLLEDRKERLLVSGFGLELLFKMQHGLL